MDYATISPELVNHLYAGHRSLKNSTIPQALKALLELRVSQINGCNYCCDLHSNEASKLGVQKEKINALASFATSNLFTENEKAALSWAESLTYLQSTQKVKDTKLGLYFNEREIVDITLCIAMMNMFNRMAISMKEE
jgi:AhpD family alkylhydroperoxidase